jgi:hypothetical protein
VAEGAPCRGSGSSGSAGGVGDGTGEADGPAETDLEGVEAAGEPPVSPSQDTTARAASIAIGSTQNLRIG